MLSTLVTGHRIASTRISLTLHDSRWTVSLVPALSITLDNYSVFISYQSSDNTLVFSAHHFRVSEVMAVSVHSHAHYQPALSL